MLCLGAIGESFYEVKGYLEELFRIFGISDLHFAAGGGDYLHPGRKAEIFLHGSRVGEIGDCLLYTSGKKQELPASHPPGFPRRGCKGFETFFLSGRFSPAHFYLEVCKD